MVDPLRAAGTWADGPMLDALAAVRRPIATASGLPNSLYTDPAPFAFERDAVLGRTWSALCFASDLPAPGYAKPVDFMGLPLLAIRDRSGAIHVFHNVCRHRGMQLVSEAQALRTVIRCPYHSWAYDLQGRLLRTPHIGGSDRHECAEFDRSQQRLASVRIALWMDIVFVNLAGDAPPLADALRPLLERWAPLVGAAGLDRFAPLPGRGRLTFDVRCNWKLAVENYCEAYHLPWVHPELNRTSPLDEHFNILIDQDMSGQGSHNYRATRVDGVHLPRLPEWSAERTQHAEYISLYPNVLLGLQSDHAFAMILQPLGPARTREHLQLSFVQDTTPDDRYGGCREALLRSWQTVFEEDVFAIEGMQKGRASPGFTGGVFTPVQDVPTHHFHRWVAGRYAGALGQDSGAQSTLA